jgi:hypothetical protein
MKYMVLMILAVLTPVLPTVLGDAVNSMNPPEWRTLNAAQPSSYYDNNNIFAYANDAIWDPVTQSVFYLGRGHGRPWKFTRYHVETNTWSLGPLPFESLHGDHSYDQLAMDTDNNHLYLYTMNSAIHFNELFRYDPTTNTWDSVEQVGASCKTVYGWGAALEYFPEMKRLVLVFGGNVSLFDPQTSAWDTLARGLNMGGFHNLAEYSPVHKVVLLGGGTEWNGGANDPDNHLYMLDSTGQITSLGTAPIPIDIFKADLTHDPVTGDFLFRSSSQLRRFNPKSRTWSTLSSGSYGDPLLQVVCAIRDYGVVAFMGQYPEFDLFKLAEGTGSVSSNYAQENAEHMVISAYPNPFNPETKIAFSCQHSAVSKIDVDIFGTNGKLVEKLIAGSRKLKGGITWNATKYPPGVYLLKLRAGNKTFCKKLILSK